MGNCLRSKKTSLVWAGDDLDWSSSVVESFKQHKNTIESNKSLVGGCPENNRASTPSTSTTVREVKIKITKKQLEKLLGSADIHEMSSVEQLLSLLMDGGSDHFEIPQHQWSWRPALQSIPELPED